MNNYFLFLEIIAESATEAIGAQQRFLDSLAKVLGNKIVPDYLLAEQGGVLICSTL